MGLFTIEFELGPNTRATIERVASDMRTMVERTVPNGVIKIELGPQTRKMIETVYSPSSEGGRARKAIGGMLGSGGE